MKILEVITSLLIGGAEHIVVQLTEDLRRRGHQVDIVVFNGEDTNFTREVEAMGPTEGGVPAVKLYRLGTGFYNPMYILQLRRIMKHYDVVHTHNSSPQLFAAIANIGLGKTLITTEHNTNNRKRGNRLLTALDMWMYKRYKRIVCISDIAKQLLEEYLYGQTSDSSDSRIVVINNGVDVDSYYNAKPLPELSHEGCLVCVMVAGFRKQKDQDTIIRAIASLPEDYELWLVGDGVRRQEIEALIAKENVGSRVKLLGVRGDVARVLKSADVVVMSSHWEGLSLSNIEGMSSGKPFIASRVNGLKEVTDGYGILFEHGNSQELADIIRRLHDDADYYRQVAEKCHERALQYDINIMTREYEKVMKNER